jgi:hypothetical protein
MKYKDRMLGPRAWKWQTTGVSLCAGLAISGAAAHSHAFPSSRFIYSRGPGAEQCPEEEAVRKEVAARLGYDPFFIWAERTIVTRIERERQGFRATVQLLDGKGIVQGSRSLTSSASDCTELAKSVALVISIGIDPEHGDPSQRALAAPAPEPSARISSPTPAPAPTVTPATALPDRAGDNHETAASPRIESLFGAGVWTGDGLAQGVSFGGTVFAGLGWGPAALFLEGRDSLQTGAAIETGLLFLSVVPCVRKNWLFACVTGSWGELRADGPRSATARYVAVGARAGLDVPVARQLSLRTHFDGAAPLDRTIVQVNGTTAWQLPAVSGALGVEASLRFQ